MINKNFRIRKGSIFICGKLNEKKKCFKNRSRKFKEDIEIVINMLKSKNKEIKKWLMKSINNLKGF